MESLTGGGMTRISADPTTGTELARLLRGPHAYRYRPAEGSPGTLGQMLRCAMGIADRPTWKPSKPLTVSEQEAFVRAAVESTTFRDAIRGAFRE